MRQQLIGKMLGQEAQYVTRHSRGVGVSLLALPSYPRTTALMEHVEGWAYMNDPEERNESFEMTYGRCLQHGEYLAWMLRSRTADGLLRVLQSRRPSSTTPSPEVAWHF